MKVALSREKKYLLDESKDFHSEFGVMSVSALKEQRIALMNQEFRIFDPEFIDFYEKIKRRAQIITLKDIGSIIAQTGLGPHSIVLEAGSGSGALGCFLAHLSKKVISYDTREDHQEIAKTNAKNLNVTNITFKIGDIREKIDESDIDIVILDIPDPWAALTTVNQTMRRGSFLVVYSPTIPQVMDTVTVLNEKFQSEMIFLKTLEIIERQWEIDGRKVRPQTSFINHTGFITFIRKV